MDSIDVVMPVAAKDAAKASLALAGLLHHCTTPIGRIHLVSPRPFPIDAPLGATLHRVGDEAFPFTIDDIDRALVDKGSRHPHASWYLQQLLKFYVFEVIEGVADRVLILDADFVISRPIAFVGPGDRSLLAYGYPFSWLRQTDDYPDTVEHVHVDFARSLVPGWAPQHAFSGMQHHMLFDRAIVEDLFDRVKSASGLPFWRAFMEAVEVEKWNAASEYVLYHHFALQYHADAIEARHVATEDLIFDAERPIPWPLFERIASETDAQAVGLHGFVELEQRLRTMDYIPDDLRRSMLASGDFMFRLALRDGRLTVSGA